MGSWCKFLIILFLLGAFESVIAQSKTDSLRSKDSLSVFYKDKLGDNGDKSYKRKKAKARYIIDVLNVAFLQSDLKKNHKIDLLSVNWMLELSLSPKYNIGAAFRSNLKRYKKEDQISHYDAFSTYINYFFKNDFEIGTGIGYTFQSIHLYEDHDNDTTDYRSLFVPIYLKKPIKNNFYFDVFYDLNFMNIDDNNSISFQHYLTVGIGYELDLLDKKKWRKLLK